MPNFAKSNNLEKRKVPQTISMKEFEEILRGTKKPKHRLAFKLAFMAGLRISEVINLRKEDVNFERDYIFIRGSKGKKDRYVPIPEPLRKDLKKLPIGLTPRALKKALKRIALKTIGKEIHFLTLRHSTVDLMLDHGIHIRWIQLLLGYSSIRTPAIYTHVSLEDLQEEFRRKWRVK